MSPLAWRTVAARCTEIAWHVALWRVQERLRTRDYAGAHLTMQTTVRACHRALSESRRGRGRVPARNGNAKSTQVRDMTTGRKVVKASGPPKLGVANAFDEFFDIFDQDGNGHVPILFAERTQQRCAAMMISDTSSTLAHIERRGLCYVD